MHLRAYRNAAEHRRVEGMTREEACERFKRKILLLARRVHEQAGAASPLSPEDLVGYGVLGLLEAFDRFEPSHRVDFASFASYRILGEMLDAVRSASGTTRRQRQMAQDLEKATKACHERLGREPTPTEVAAQMGVPMEEYWRMRGATAELAFEHLPHPGEAEEPEDIDALAAAPEAPLRMLALDARAALRDAIGKLPERERQVILLYYGRDLSLAEVGAVLEVTPSRVCQILSDARNRLRKAIGREVDMDLFAVEGAA